MAASRFPQPAFPSIGQAGISMRDYFAAAVLNGLCASPQPPGGRLAPPAESAQLAYEYADAMLARRAA